MKNDYIQTQIEAHQREAVIYLKLSSDNLAVAMSENDDTNFSRNRKMEYLGYAEDYALRAKEELTKAYTEAHWKLSL